jgi:hypothetical protein
VLAADIKSLLPNFEHVKKATKAYEQKLLSKFSMDLMPKTFGGSAESLNPVPQ